MPQFVLLAWGIVTVNRISCEWWFIWASLSRSVLVIVEVVDVVQIVASVASATSYVGDTLQKEEERRRNQPDVMKTLGEWGQDEREREMTDFERENPNILMLNSTSDEFKNMWRECVAFYYASDELSEEWYPSLVTRLRTSRLCTVKNVAVKLQHNLLVPQL